MSEHTIGMSVLHHPPPHIRKQSKEERRCRHNEHGAYMPPYGMKTLFAQAKKLSVVHTAKQKGKSTSRRPGVQHAGGQTPNACMICMTRCALQSLLYPTPTVYVVTRCSHARLNKLRMLWLLIAKHRRAVARQQNTATTPTSPLLCTQRKPTSMWCTQPTEVIAQ